LKTAALVGAAALTCTLLRRVGFSRKRRLGGGGERATVHYDRGRRGCATA